MTWHLDGLNSMSQAFPKTQDVEDPVGVWRVSKDLENVKYKAVSSANNLTLDSTCSGS